MGAVFIVAAGGCACCSREPLTREARVVKEIQLYYQAAAQAFASANAEALASLYTPDISKPMTQAQILEWGHTFFLQHPQARLLVENLAFDEIAPDEATVTLTYKVVTPDHMGEFGGKERDSFAKRERWLIRSWEKLEPPPR
jgi:predicted lipid-binding transport protein (Tim44 family)